MSDKVVFLFSVNSFKEIGFTHLLNNSFSFSSFSFESSISVSGEAINFEIRSLYFSSSLLQK